MKVSSTVVTVTVIDGVAARMKVEDRTLYHRKKDDAWFINWMGGKRKVEITTKPTNFYGMTVPGGRFVNIQEVRTIPAERF